MLKRPHYATFKPFKNLTTLQSIAVIKTAFHRSVHNSMTRSYRININYLESFGTKFVKSVKFIYKNNSPLPVACYQNFVHSCVTESLVRYINFCVLFSVWETTLCSASYWIMPSSLIDCKVLENNGRDVTEQKWAYLRILVRYAMVEFRAKFKKRLRFTFNRFSTLDNWRSSCFSNSEYRRMR